MLSYTLKNIILQISSEVLVVLICFYRVGKIDFFKLYTTVI